MNNLTIGFSKTPARSPWGINFGGGLNSTAMIVECRNRGLTPAWILFADTGSEIPGTLDHVHAIREWCAGWCDLTVVRWERTKGEVLGFEPLHENCLRTGYLPSKAYGYAGCTQKWKIQPMDKWRKERGFDSGLYAVGYDAGEWGRIKTACERGDAVDFTAWYPLVAWNIDRAACQKICDEAGFPGVGKSSCFICPNMQRSEWAALKIHHTDLFDLAVKIETKAVNNNNGGRWGGLCRGSLANLTAANQASLFDDDSPDAVDDRCHHAGCFT